MLGLLIRVVRVRVTELGLGLGLGLRAFFLFPPFCFSLFIILSFPVVVGNKSLVNFFNP